MIAKDQKKPVLYSFRRVRMMLAGKGVLIHFSPNPFNLLFGITYVGDIVSPMARSNYPLEVSIRLELAHINHHSPSFGL